MGNTGWCTDANCTLGIIGTRHVVAAHYRDYGAARDSISLLHQIVPGMLEAEWVDEPGDQAKLLKIGLPGSSVGYRLSRVEARMLAEWIISSEPLVTMWSKGIS